MSPIAELSFKAYTPQSWGVNQEHHHSSYDQRGLEYVAGNQLTIDGCSTALRLHGILIPANLLVVNLHVTLYKLERDGSRPILHRTGQKDSEAPQGEGLQSRRHDLIRILRSPLAANRKGTPDHCPNVAPHLQSVSDNNGATCERT